MNPGALKGENGYKQCHVRYNKCSHLIRVPSSGDFVDNDKIQISVTRQGGAMGPPSE